MTEKPEYTIDWGSLDWTPDERRKARHIVATSPRPGQKMGDLTLPANCRDVTSENSGKKFAIIDPPYRLK